jgi:hypothetical protein
MCEQGELTGGFILVGPHPVTDPNDRVVFGEKRYGPYGHGYSQEDGLDDSPFSDLEVCLR